jgi:hypothetical protein
LIVLEDIVALSNSWFFKPFQIITHLRKIRWQVYVACGNQFLHITFQLALFQLTWLQQSNVGWMNKQHSFPLNFVYVDQYCGWLRVHIICYPRAFNMTTCPFHWELLPNVLFKVSCYFLLPIVTKYESFDQVHSL